MCGIVGAITEKNLENILLEGLKRLEYRGYDSAGIAVINNDGNIERLRSVGKVNNLSVLVEKSSLKGTAGIAHTRWATHGVPSERNAHPLLSHDQFALVHNGIIENHDVLRAMLIEKGYEFSSETDTETIVHLLHYHYTQHADLLPAIHATINQLEGAYALGIITSHHPDRLIAVRHGSPLIVGKGNNGNFIGSDILALLHVTQEFYYLEDGDIADITQDNIDIYTKDGKRIERTLQLSKVSYDAIDRGTHKHYMYKEIMEQPLAMTNHIEGRLDKTHLHKSIFGLGTDDLFSRVEHVQLVACGTSYHAAMVARYWIESLAGLSCSVEVASEFRYRKSVTPVNSLFVTLSQSGETADTLAALRHAKQKNFLSTLAICNVPDSSIVRESEFHFMTRAGSEIGVASTKAFTTQLTALLMLTLALGSQRNMTAETTSHLTLQLHKLPSLIENTLKLDTLIKKLAEKFIDKAHTLFLGRSALYPIALEGALKLKEISYIHAEAYPAGELKHGPLALVDKHMPIVAIVPNNELLEKTKSNLHEVHARGGMLFVFTDHTTGITEDLSNLQVIEMPVVDPVIAPILYTIPMQLLAYHVAVLKGTDVDQPRNLAKSVTVE